MTTEQFDALYLLIFINGGFICLLLGCIYGGQR